MGAIRVGKGDRMSQTTVHYVVGIDGTTLIGAVRAKLP